MVGSRDVLLGTIHGCEFYMAADQFEFWKNTHLTIDVTEGRGASFSLEIPRGNIVHLYLQLGFLSSSLQVF